jgi:UDP-2,3-diacylglucosamine hydrolase
MNIELESGKKVYFISDFHLGAPTHNGSLERERRITAWLDEIKEDTQVVFLMGDLFDFWFEYKSVVPKGYVRLLGKLAELSDSGIQLYIFPGNHDLWMLDYFNKELGAVLFEKPQDVKISGKLFHIGHGDGLGPGDRAYKFIKSVLFKNVLFQWLFRFVLPPDLGQYLGKLWASASYKKNRKEDLVFEEINKEEEFIYQYIKEMENDGNHHDFYIFGHRHIAMDVMVNEKARYINLGDWIRYDSYAVYDGVNLNLTIRNSGK